MPTLLLTAANLHEFEHRIHAVRSDSARRWGSLEPAAMLNHLDYMLKVSLEEISEKDRGNFVTRNIVRRIAFHTPLPWPKGLKTSPSFTQAPNVSIDEIRAQLLNTMKRFTETAARESKRKTLHPMFGMLTLQYWGRVHGKHFNHHFTQFGV